MKRRIFSFLLAVVMVFSLAPSVFAAEDTMISTAVDKTTVAAGETITVTYTMNRAVDEVSLITIAPKYDKTVLTFQSVDYADSVFFQSPKSGASALVGGISVRRDQG